MFRTCHGKKCYYNKKKMVHVDILFIQATAVLLGLDIYVTSENSKRETPFTIIKSTWHTNNDSVTDNKPVIYLASIDSNHFQSLIVLPHSDHNYAMHMPAYQTHHQNYFIPASFGDCHVDFHRQVTIKKTHTNRRKKSNSAKFEEKMNKIKIKTKNASKKDKYNNENMSPTTVDVKFEQKMDKRKRKNASKKDKYNNENMSPTTVDVKFEQKMDKRKRKNASKKDKYNDENMPPTTVDVKFQQKMNKRKRKNASKKDEYNENMSPATVDVPNADENMQPTAVDVHNTNENMPPTTVDVKFEQKMDKIKRKRKNTSKKDKYNENMSPTTVDVLNTDENMSPITVDVPNADENISPTTVDVPNADENMQQTAVDVPNNTDENMAPANADEQHCTSNCSTPSTELNSIHPNPRVINAIQNFEQGEMAHTINTCVICNETRPVFYSSKPLPPLNPTGTIPITVNSWKIFKKDNDCKRCHLERNANNRKGIQKAAKFSGIYSREIDMGPVNHRLRHNNMHFESVPPYLQNLSTVETALISRITVLF